MKLSIIDASKEKDTLDVVGGSAHDKTQERFSDSWLYENNCYAL